MKNKVGFVTGGAGHIGSTTCYKMAELGCKIIVVDKNKDNSHELLKKLKEINGIDHLYLNLDLLDPRSFKEAAMFVESEVGKLDYLVNCAAFYDDTPGWGVSFEEETYEAWQKVLSVNTMAPFFLAQSLNPYLQKNEGGAIVNVSSIYGIVAPDFSLYDGTTMSNPAVYGVSKGGLQQATKWLSSVLAPKVRVNAVTPGGVERGQNPIFQERYKKRTPLKRMATEEDVANAITYLLSDKASFVTGHNFVVDGGWTVW